MSKHVVVIGGGIIGLCSAYELLRAGHHVTVIEKESIENQGCSWGNAGMVVPSHFIPLAAPGMVSYGMRAMLNPAGPFGMKVPPSARLIRWALAFMRFANQSNVDRCAPHLAQLNLASLAAYKDIETQVENGFGLRTDGLLMLCKTQHSLDEEARLVQQAGHLGIEARAVTGAELAAIDPGIQMNVAGGVFFPGDAFLSPMRLLNALRHTIDQKGGRFLSNTKFTEWKLANKSIGAINTEGGSVEGEEFVLAAGSWSPELAQKLGISLPIVAGKGYSVTVPTPPKLPKVCSIFLEARIAVTPMDGQLRFAGTMELGEIDLSINPIRLKGIFKSIPNYFPEFQGFEFASLPVWSGLRPCTPDGMPIIGRPNSFDNLIIASGHSMMGLSLGPITGRLVAELASDERPSLDIQPYNPSRFN